MAREVTRRARTVRANGLEIACETFGEEEDAALLLVMGLGGQMLFWDEAFCAMLAERGHFVIRYDHRDVGLSTKLDHLGDPDVSAVFAARGRGEDAPVPYLLADMADDAAGLLDGLSIDAAHVFGISMGGMIGQELALRHPARVRSLTSMMSTTGDPSLPGPKPAAFDYLMSEGPLEREAYAERAVEGARVIGGSGFPVDEERIYQRTLRAYDRCFHVSGYARHLVAVVASGSRAERLRELRVPTLVIHGDEDPLVPVECGIATAKAVPGAALEIVEGLGHSLPSASWPRLVDRISSHTISGGR